MTILVTGATGTIGRLVTQQLVQRNANVRALVRDPVKADLPAAVSLVQGDLLDPDTVRNALQGVSTLFLLNAAVADEFTQALVTLNLAKEAGVQHVVYLSVINSERSFNVPHFAGKYAVERMIEQMGIRATILQPAYFMSNELTIKDAVQNYGIYPMPLGSKGIAMIDPRDIAEIAAIALTSTAGTATVERLTLAGPDDLTGTQAAAIWSEVLGRSIVYPGDDTLPLEQTLRNVMPGWMAYDMRLMADRFHTDGMLAAPGDRERLTAMLGRPLRSYRDYVAEIAGQ
jgi:uncharacterized protein YbjT (DUF2867 family)